MLRISLIYFIGRAVDKGKVSVAKLLLKFLFLRLFFKDFSI